MNAPVDYSKMPHWRSLIELEDFLHDTPLLWWNDFILLIN